MNTGKSRMDAIEQSGKGESAEEAYMQGWWDAGNEMQLSLQLSVVGLINLEWLAGEWKITEAEG